MINKKKPSPISKHLYVEFCERYYDNLVDYVLHHCSMTPTWQQIDVCRSVQVPGSWTAIASGHGCFGEGTPIRLFDGTTKSVEFVDQKDVVMGHDGTPRTVHSLCYGEEPLYRFHFPDGRTHIYNDQHILVLFDKKGEMKKEAVQHWLKWNDEKKSSYGMSHNGELVAIQRVEYLGEGPYFGFELVESPFFLHGDGTLLHNTGKSFLAAWILDWNLRVFPYSNAMLTATNIEQARKGVWKYLEGVIRDMDNRCPWMKGWFVKQAKLYYAKGSKDDWYVMPKTASKDKPENVAGQHNANYLVFVDEASGVSDAVLGVIQGALTEERNRLVMASQPTRPTGEFADAMTKLAKRELPDGRIDGLYNAFTLNSEESPLVSKDSIRKFLLKYGGHHSPEYQIKVLGRLPDNLAGYLIPKKWCEDCQYYEIKHPEEWGWVLTADVAEGVHRDSSVMTIAKVSGYGPERHVEVVDCSEYLDLNEKQFARHIAAKYNELPSLTIAVDADGAGRTVVLELEELGIPVEQIHWGLPAHTSADQKRYLNQRAYAHLKLREAIFEERHKMVVNKKFVEQASRLPYEIDERGRYKMMSKDRMRTEGIKSPDICDTNCFLYLVDYIPCVSESVREGSVESEFLKMAKMAVGEE